MISTTIGYANTARTLASLSQQRATGELTLSSGDRQWKLYFFHGRLVYGTGSLHRVRRWYRAVKQHHPHLNADCVSQEEPWEYHLLSHHVAQNQLNAAQAQTVIKSSLEEVLFSLVSNPVMTSDWYSMQRFSLKDNAALSLLLSSSQVEQVLQRSQALWKQWKALELDALSPYRAPILRQAAPTDSSSISPLPDKLNPFLTGQHTLWDIAAHAQRPITVVTQFLLPWLQQGAIALEEIPDLPPPLRQVHCPTGTGGKKKRPVIACIDDSPTVGQVLAAILEPAGYRVVNIQDPLSGIATLVKHKPDLIFLDLVMPDTSGYNLCNFLRKTPTFQNTPIIILTSQDGILDRTRARLAGATDFLTKPPEPQTMINLVQSHLGSILPLN
ncbi:response regulator [Leptothermofonsia sichuanensis E412]|uniref:response regulator n=1 Tax=Leptothermofonsia sichuanensis TaxID=2917832 RepID=UPI001CA67D52|nr:response regulator [Leptothermofonsia sichuanensis]QZZ21351.1 response regulator [Leptothermofonsia sichuanensis E412]